MKFIELRIFIVILHHFYISTPSNLVTAAREAEGIYFMYYLPPSLSPSVDYRSSIRFSVWLSSICSYHGVKACKCNNIYVNNYVSHTTRYTSLSISSTNQIFLQRLPSMFAFRISSFRKHILLLTRPFNLFCCLSFHHLLSTIE